MLPIKSNDLVDHDGEKYLVRSVQVTKSGVVLTCFKILENEPVTFHADEIKLSTTDAKDRARSLRNSDTIANANDKQRAQTLAEVDESVKQDEAINTVAEGGQVVIPENITKSEAEEILKRFAKMKNGAR